MATRSMNIEKMEGGFQTSSHPEQSTKGEYKMPESKVHKHHGSIMHEVHEMVHGHGSAGPADDEKPCPMCDSKSAKGSKGQVAPKPARSGEGSEHSKGKPTIRTASTLSEKAAKASK